ncbi:hypothetical protein V1292_001488 [Bradyrhizobium sp. AZCC 1719]
MTGHWRDTGAAAHQMLQASSELSKQSETMRGRAGAYRFAA